MYIISLKKTQRVSFIRYLLQDFFNIGMLFLFIIFNFQCICCLLMFCRTEISVIQLQFLEAFHNSFISLNLAIKQHILEDIRKELREYYNAMVSFMIDFYSQLHLILLRNMAIPHILLFTMLLIFELATLFSFFLFFVCVIFSLLYLAVNFVYNSIFLRRGGVECF